MSAAAVVVVTVLVVAAFAFVIWDETHGRDPKDEP